MAFAGDTLTSAFNCVIGSISSIGIWYQEFPVEKTGLICFNFFILSNMKEL